MHFWVSCWCQSSSWPCAGAELEFTRLALCRNGASRLLREQEISLAALWRGELTHQSLGAPGADVFCWLSRDPFMRQAAEADGCSFWGGFGWVFLADVGGLCFPQVQGSLVQQKHCWILTNRSLCGWDGNPSSHGQLLQHWEGCLVIPGQHLLAPCLWNHFPREVLYSNS